MSEQVILVDAEDMEVGAAAKAYVHATGQLHRAFSVFVFDASGRMLLQQRALTKYHSGGLWSNTCCSHPRPGESTAAAAMRRLEEELGFSCPLHAAFSFVYRADVGGGLIEHEYDHVFIGSWNGEPVPDPAEVRDWRWAMPADIEREMLDEPGRFTFWFHVAFDELRRRGYLEHGNDHVHGERPHVHHQHQPGNG